MIESNRPLVTFALFAYNQKKYIRAAISAALAQNYSPLEIIISDDCSTDNTFEIIEELVRDFNGSIKVIVNKNQENLGTARHVNKVLEMASGEFVVMAAGDDISKPNRTEFLVNSWLLTGKADCSIFTNAIVIDSQGDQFGVFYKSPNVTHDINEFLEKKTCWVGGFSHGFPIKLYKKYGPISSDTFQEDGAISFRALLNSGIKYFEDTTVFYRRHEENSYDVAKYGKLKKLYRSELGLARGRINDMAKHLDLTDIRRSHILKILNEDIRVKSLFVKFPIFIRSLLFVRRLRISVRSFLKFSARA